MSENDRKDIETPIEAEHEEERHIELGSDLRKEVKRRKPMSSKKKLIVGLCAVAAVALVVGGLYLALRLTDDTDSQPVQESSSIDLITDTYKEIESIVLDNEETLTVRNDGAEKNETYFVDEMEDAVVEQDECASLFTAIGTLKADDVVETAPADLGLYGLDEPLARMTVNFKNGTSRSFLLGDPVPTTAQYYFMEEGGDTVYLLSSYLSGKVRSNRSTFHNASMPTVDSEFGKSLIVRKRGEPDWRIRLSDESVGNTLTSWKLTEPETYAGIDVSVSAVQDIIDHLADATLSRFVTTVDSEEGLAEYGLDDPLITLIYVDQNNVTRRASIGNKDENNYYYVRIDDSLDVYLAAYGQFSFAEEIEPVNLLDRFASLINIANVDKVEITKGFETYTMQIQRQDVTKDDGTTETEETLLLNGKVMDESMFRKAYQTIIGISHSGLCEQEKAGSEVVLSVKFYFNNGSEDLLIEYLPYDVNNYAIRRNGKLLFYGRKDPVDEIWTDLQQLEAGTLSTEN